MVSAGLDAMGGLAVMAAIGARHMDEAPSQRLHRFGKLGTIDLRIDYLRPAIGEHFELRAEVLRLGSRWRARAWNSWAPTASCCRAARRLHHFLSAAFTTAAAPPRSRARGPQQ